MNFQSSIQKSIEWNDLNNVEFAMWLPCDQDKIFKISPIIDKWTTVYSLTKDYWSYITADLLKTLELVDDKTFRLGLPDNFQAFAFLTADNEQMILSLSKEKGSRFHFAETTTLEYRATGADNLIERIDFKKSYCVLDFVNDYNAYGGNAYGLANTLSQAAVLKPKIRNRRIKNLFYTGQLTVPGPGVPPSIISGKIVAREVCNFIN